MPGWAWVGSTVVAGWAALDELASCGTRGYGLRMATLEFRLLLLCREGAADVCDRDGALDDAVVAKRPGEDVGMRRSLDRNQPSLPSIVGPDAYVPNAICLSCNAVVVAASAGSWGTSSWVGRSDLQIRSLCALRAGQAGVVLANQSP